MEKCKINSCQFEQAQYSRSAIGLCQLHSEDINNLYGYENVSDLYIKTYIECHNKLDAHLKEKWNFKEIKVDGHTVKGIIGSNIHISLENNETGEIQHIQINRHNCVFFRSKPGMISYCGDRIIVHGSDPHD